MVNLVKKKMRRPYKTSNTDVGTRLEQAIQQTWGSHRALAEETGMTEGTISNYVRHGRLPAGAEMVKLAQALPGQIDYILTGVRPTELTQRTVGSLPPPVRRMVEAAMQIEDDAELLHALEVGARLFAQGDTTLTSVKLPREAILALAHLLQSGTELRTRDPLFP